jgi:hypothetical protein
MRVEGVTCTLTSVDGCVLISGSVDLTVLEAMSAGMPKGTVLDFDVQRLGGYSFAFGPPKALAAIAKRLGDAEMVSLLASHPRFSEAARRWLSYGEVGASSAAMFWGCTGHIPRGAKVNVKDPAWPLDPADLRRCLALVESVPECAAGPESMRGKSEAWTRLADAWPSLLESIAAEVPEWRSGKGGNAPKTYEMMKRALGDVK